MSNKQSTKYYSKIESLFFLDDFKELIRILTSVELVWLKWAFFTDWRINNTTGWKNTLSETEIANKKSVLPAVLGGRISGEVSYA